MKKNDKEKQESLQDEVPEVIQKREGGEFDDFVRELALRADSLLNVEDTEAVRACFLTYVRDTVKEYEQLCDIARAMEKNPRIKKFIELLLHGETPGGAISGAGLDDVFMNSVKEKEIEYEELTEQQRKEIEERCAGEIRDFYRTRNVDKERLVEFVAFAEEMISSIYYENIGTKLLEQIWKAFAYDDDIKDAFEKGAVSGRNEKIEALRRERNNSDGTGAVSGGAVTAPKTSYVGYIERLMGRHS